MPAAINLFLAALWLAAAGVLFLWPALVPGARAPMVFETGIPWAWAALFLAAYNVLRWLVTRATRPRRQAVQREAGRRWAGRDRGRLEQPPDPTFDFSEGPPPRKPQRPGGPSGSEPTT